jgi:DNA-binding GntR family transcriptional regulator
MNDIYQCRQRLKSLTARLAATKITPQQSDSLFRIFENIETAWNKKEKELVVDLNIQFHKKIHEASGNQQLISLNNMLRDKVTYLRNCSFKMSVRDDGFLAEHERILIALHERDGEKSKREMHEHIQHDLQALTSLYKNTRG